MSKSAHTHLSGVVYTHDIFSSYKTTRAQRSERAKAGELDLTGS